jgi:hypothetical protein
MSKWHPLTSDLHGQDVTADDLEQSGDWLWRQPEIDDENLDITLWSPEGRLELACFGLRGLCSVKYLDDFLVEWAKEELAVEWGDDIEPPLRNLRNKIDALLKMNEEAQRAKANTPCPT